MLQDIWKILPHFRNISMWSTEAKTFSQLSTKFVAIPSFATKIVPLANF
jgi:hypothetical protein